jgi:hypothetical protein
MAFIGFHRGFQVCLSCFWILIRGNLLASFWVFLRWLRKSLWLDYSIDKVFDNVNTIIKSLVRMY